MSDTVFYLECWFEGCARVGSLSSVSLQRALKSRTVEFGRWPVFLRAAGEESEVRVFWMFSDEMEDYIREMEVKTGSGFVHVLVFQF